MIFDSKIKEGLFIGLLVFVLGGLAIGYVSNKNKPKVSKIVLEGVSESVNPESACEAIAEEKVPDVPAKPVEELKPVLKDEESKSSGYPLHSDISSTIFWVGESASDENDNISNSPSAWDEQWKKHYGGVDSSTKRDGFLPSKFCPKENPFYVALPYNDFGKNGKHKEEIFSLVPWVKNRNIPDDYSVLKNRWIKIIHGGETAYAQWEDVGPFGESDKEYVFGSANPKSKENKNAGIDVSPAVRDYLGLSGIDKVDWQFVDFEDVPDGAWKKIITKSQVYWE
jgi:hypothetical protein